MHSPTRRSAASTPESTSRTRTTAASGRLPEGGASYTPPGYYALAALAIRIGEALGMETPEHARAAPQRALPGRLRRARARARAATPAGPPARALERAGVLRLLPGRAQDGSDVPPTAARDAALPCSRSTTTAWMVARRDYRLHSGPRSRCRSRARSSSAPSRSGWSASCSSRSWRRRSRSANTGDGSGRRSPCARSRSCCCHSRGTSTTGDGRQRGLWTRHVIRSHSTTRGRPSSTSTLGCRT